MSSSSKHSGPLWLTQRQIAKAFGVSTRTVNRWHDDGFPHHGEGRGIRYHLPDCIEWALARERRDLEDQLDAMQDLDSARTRRMLALAKKTELEAEKMAERMIDIDDLEELHLEPLGRIREAMVSAPPRFAPLLDKYPKRQAMKLLKQIFHDFMATVAELGGDQG